jgi:hypothetical protein
MAKETFEVELLYGGRLEWGCPRPRGFIEAPSDQNESILKLRSK